MHLECQTQLSPVEPFVSTKARWMEAKCCLSSHSGGGDIESISLLNKYHAKRYLVKIEEEIFEFIHDGHLDHRERVEKVQYLAERLLKRDLQEYLCQAKEYSKSLESATWLR